MSDFFRDATEHRSRDNRRCTYCGEPINKGDFYKRQTGVWDGSWFVSRFHHECFDDLCEQGEGEFAPYENERPEVAKATGEQA